MAIPDTARYAMGGASGVFSGGGVVFGGILHEFG
jgi:hypothetical protein